MKNTLQLTSIQKPINLISLNFLSFFNVLLIFGVFAFFITLSIQNNHLFLSEMLLGGGVVMLICFLNIISGE
jgi:high-affinity Fe2+/Pb2+ permease